jgi:DNA helicase-2/ATP-dependent DNA helicase PcrA
MGCMVDDVLEGLNEEQIQAVTSTEGYIRVIAGAGSGKTRALTHRFAYLVNELGIRPGNILCVTFTNKAANEMKARIHELTDDNDAGFICTFHSFCVSVLQEDSHAISYPKSFLVLDNSDIDAMLKIIYEERGLTLRDKTFKDARGMFEMRKGVSEPDYYENLIQMSLEDLRKKYMDAKDTDDILFYGYLYQEKKCFGLDYNDLIYLTLHILKSNPEIRLKWQKRLEYIMIDEFQDIDPPQYELMENLCGYHNNLFIVGDPDQTIYTWRGARVGYLLNFDQKFPDVKTIMMMKNYRSTPETLACANSLIEKNDDRMKKELVPVLPAGRKPVCHHASSSLKEAEWIRDEIHGLHAQGVPYEDITILYRAHYVTRPIEQALIEAKIPYVIYSGEQFYDRMEIKDALSYLRMTANQDDLSFDRIVNVPKRNIGQKRMKFLLEYSEKKHVSHYEALKENIDDPLFANTQARAFIDLVEETGRHMKEKPVSELLTDILDQSGYEKMLRTEGAQDRLDDLAELKQSIYEWETTVGEETDLASYLRQIALFTNTDLAGTKNKVKMMTVHSAKGLQFPYVFIASLSEGIFPSRKVRTKEGMEEERRLAFVAVTRAEKELYLSDAEGRNFNDTSRYPSRFLLDIDPECLSYTEKPDEKLLEKARANIERINNSFLPDLSELGLHEGDRVEHRVFGPGTIMKINDEEEEIEIQFDSLKTPRSIAMRAAKKLKKIMMS